VFSLKHTDLRVRVNAVLRGVLGQLYEVLSVTLHPDYDPETMDYDVALLEVSKFTLAITTFIRAVSGLGLRPSACWDRGFESHRGHGCSSCIAFVLSGRGL
jgi:hypothetical protein